MPLRLQSQRIYSLIAELEKARAAGTLGAVLTQIEKDDSTNKIVAFYEKFVDMSFIASEFRTEHVQAITRRAVQLIRGPIITFLGTPHKQQLVNKDTGEPSGTQS